MGDGVLHHRRGQRVGLHLHLPLVDSSLRNAQLGLPAQHLRRRGRAPFPVPSTGYPANNLIRDNVFTDATNGITDSSGANWGTQDHNLNSGFIGLRQHHRHTGLDRRVEADQLRRLSPRPRFAREERSLRRHRHRHTLTRSESARGAPRAGRGSTGLRVLLSTPPVTSGQCEGDQKVTVTPSRHEPGANLVIGHHERSLPCSRVRGRLGFAREPSCCLIRQLSVSNRRPASTIGMPV